MGEIVCVRQCLLNYDTMFKSLAVHQGMCHAQTTWIEGRLEAAQGSVRGEGERRET